MKPSLRTVLVALGTALGVLLGPMALKAETASLELKRMDPPDKGPGGYMAVPGAQLQVIRSYISPQSAFTQILEKPSTRKDEQAEEFARSVKKEPEKYHSKYPVRGVMTLGSDKYGYVLDAKDDKSSGYSRLLFDLNHNGDLTDDKALSGETQGEKQSGFCNFPRIDLVVNAGGAKVDSSFFFQVYWQTAGQFKYTSVSLSSAAYREGEVTLEGKKRRLVLIDGNSNGQFNDEVKARKSGPADGQIYPIFGDVLLVDPDLKSAPFSPYYRMRMSSAAGQMVSKLLRIDGRFYEVKISPAGDQVTLTPSKALVGQVTSAHEGLSALLYDDDLGFLRVTCGKSEPAILPEGEWRLVSYTIDRTGWKEPPPPAGKEKKPEKPPKAQRSLLEVMAEALLGGKKNVAVGRPAERQGPTFVSAEGTEKSPQVLVAAARPAVLPFGPPYKATVQAVSQGEKVARLQLSLVGAGGEVCDDMMVLGGRPSQPEFTIKTLKGEVVDRGKFEYG